MKNIKTYEGFTDFIKSKVNNTKTLLMLKKYGIKNYTINKDGSVDVDGSVSLGKFTPASYIAPKLTKLPLKFGKVTGNFSCDNNQLKSLEGAPHSVGGFFSCNENKLTSLEGAPHTVGGHFWCRDNNISSFEGLVNIGSNFYCQGNPLSEIWRIINSELFSRASKWDNEKMEFFNDLDIIRGEEIAIERFNFFLEEIGLDPVEEVRGYKNIY